MRACPQHGMREETRVQHEIMHRAENRYWIGRMWRGLPTNKKDLYMADRKVMAAIQELEGRTMPREPWGTEDDPLIDEAVKVVGWDHDAVKYALRERASYRRISPVAVQKLKAALQEGR